MTRVNILNPKDLTDQHLIAERLELTFVLSSAKRSNESKKGLHVAPKFTLNAGHVSFFHDKLQYIKNRFNELTQEMIDRGMNPQMPYPREYDTLPKGMWKDYVPTHEDETIIKERIVQRIMLKPEWYRYRGESIGDGSAFLQKHRYI